MKKEHRIAKKSFAASLKTIGVSVKRKAAKHKQPIAISKNGIAYLVDANGRKTKMTA